MTEKKQGHLAMLTASVIFALNVPITKSLIPEWVAPPAMTTLRIVFATLMFWLVSFFQKKEKVEMKDFPVIIFGSFFGMAFNQMMFIIGLSKTSPIDSSIIATLSPVMVMLISAVVLKEPITAKKALGVIIGALGAILIIVMQTHEGAKTSSWVGNLFCLIAAASYAIYLVITKPVTMKYSPVTLLKWMFLFSTFMIIPFTYQDVISAKVFAEFNESAVIRVVYVLFFATFVSYFLIPVALKRIRPTTVGSYNYLQPLVASFAAIAVGQDVLTWEKPTAALLIFSGVYLVTMSKSRADMEREKAMLNE
jgi:Permeases of the drug/metabolite transporter (DMT) superfamily